jgi:hypothetical protein
MDRAKCYILADYWTKRAENAALGLAPFGGNKKAQVLFIKFCYEKAKEWELKAQLASPSEYNLSVRAERSIYGTR